MVELLIYQGPHWMDQLNEIDLTNRMKDSNFANKYNSRYRKGDIVQVFTNGTCTEPSAKETKLCIVKCSELSMEEARELDKPLEDKKIMIQRRKYGINLDSITRDTKTGDATRDISKIEFETLKIERTLLTEVTR